MTASRNFFQLNDTDRQRLRTDWLALAGRQGASAELVQREYDFLVRHYEARGRHYHNSSHIAALLRWCGKYETSLQRPDIVRYAIWFHDVIYRSRRPNNEDNEALSADYAADALRRLSVSDAESPESMDVQALIRATAKHRLDELPAHLKHDGSWFLDFDLAILGSRAEVYDEYAQAIRREYRWVPGPLYRRGRRQVLLNFQARPHLFFTTTLQNEWEAPARQNLARELAALA
jgi:predicted metal-dependent HD superfamily phosphohydrolase